jgi:hypothetical protein
MLNTNVGDMPLDIFSDYISDTINMEWNWQYLVLAINDGGLDRNNAYGQGYSYHFSVIEYNNEIIRGYGNGNGSGYGVICAYGNGTGDGNGNNGEYLVMDSGHGVDHKGNG